MRITLFLVLCVCFVSSCTEQDFVEINDCYGLNTADYYQMYEGLELLNTRLMEGGFETHAEKIALFSSLLDSSPKSARNYFIELFNLSQTDLLFINDKLGAYLYVLQDEQFLNCFKNWIANQSPEISSLKTTPAKGLFAGIAAFFGAGGCVTGPLNIIDTAVHIAVGVLTAPTGVGAVLNWGTAVVSYGNGIKQMVECVST